MMNLLKLRLLRHSKSSCMYVLTELSTMTAAVDDDVNQPPCYTVNATNDERT